MARTSVSPAELTVLECLWRHGPGSAREILTRLDPPADAWAYTTVTTLLSRLADKGCVRRRARGTAHVWSAARTREQLLGRELDDLVERMASKSATPLLAQLIERQRLDPDELARLRAAIAELERKARDSRRTER